MSNPKRAAIGQTIRSRTSSAVAEKPRDANAPFQLKIFLSWLYTTVNLIIMVYVRLCFLRQCQWSAVNKVGRKVSSTTCDGRTGLTTAVMWRIIHKTAKSGLWARLERNYHYLWEDSKLRIKRCRQPPVQFKTMSSRSAFLTHYERNGQTQNAYNASSGKNAILCRHCMLYLAHRQ